MSDRRRRTGRQETVATYKAILRECLDRRPSGTRQRIASALGTHRSFVSQITNPSDPTQIPARHVPLILELVHATDDERARFNNAWAKAHRGPAASNDAPLKTISLEIPVLPDRAAQAALEDLIRTTALRLAAIARMQTPDTGPARDKERTG